jgi:hypothetical protein
MNIRYQLKELYKGVYLCTIKALGGYDESVMMDEVQAYLITEQSMFEDTLYKSEYNEIKHVAKELKHVFNHYYIR